MSEETCKVCGCTNDKACDGGCWWVAKELCSKCADKLIQENNQLKQELEKLEEKYINNVPCCNEEDCDLFKNYMLLQQQLKDKNEKISKAIDYFDSERFTDVFLHFTNAKDTIKRELKDILESNKED